MKRLLAILLILLLMGTASAVPVNFTNWSAHGDAWKANNNTYTRVMWNATGSHSWVSTGNATSVIYLVVAGGGGGGAGGLGAGGGAGGVLSGSTSVSDTVNVTVGGGGAGGLVTPTAGSNGGNSSFLNVTFGDGINTLGGGGGGSRTGTTNVAGKNGGSGGGGIFAVANGTGLFPQGYAGGGSTSSSNYGTGGGGGAGSVGVTGTTTYGGDGGNGVDYSALFGTDFGVSGCIAGGGGGVTNSLTRTLGLGKCGGGNGRYDAIGYAATAGTGSGGGGIGRTLTTDYAGGAGGSGVVILQYQTLEAPVANFTCTPTTAMLGESIACTDTSSDTPTNWTYYWGDGNITDGTQNPSYTYPFTGTFSINQTVNNTLGSSWYNRSNYITITNISGFTQQDLWQTGHYTKIIHITDSSTNAPIPIVVVTDSNGQSYTTTNGTAYFTEDAGAVVFYFAATGYVSKSMSYIIDGDSEDTVQMVAADTNQPVYNVYPPKDVKFHITSFFGAPLTDATVTIQGITTSTGNWDWLVTLLGISLDEVAINGTAMSETTDSNGDVVFLMLPSVKYNITTTAPGYTFPTSFIAPQATEYTITANWNESWFSSGNDTLKDVNVSVSWVKFNDTYSFVNITYDDQTMITTGGTITVYRDSVSRVANASAISTMDITSSSCSNSTLVNTPTGGASYRVLVNATTTDENIMRTFTHYFKGSPVSLPGWTSETLLWLSLFIVIFTAAFAGAIHSPQMSIVLCVESWIFWAIGWLDALITQFWYGETAIIGVLVLASFLAVMWNITEGKSKVKRSS